MNFSIGSHCAAGFRVAIHASMRCSNTWIDDARADYANRQKTSGDCSSPHLDRC
jgi:hypothetical protein